jgi:hypothetical protein
MPTTSVDAVERIAGTRRVRDAERRTLFPSLRALVEHVQSLPLVSDPDGPSQWAGGSLNNAYRLATSGWPEGADHARRVAPDVVRTMVGTAMFDSSMVDLAPSVCGALDLGAYLAGVPECCVVVTPTADRPTCRMLVSIAASGAVSSDVLRRRAVSIAAIVWALETAGYAVSITAVDAGAPRDPSHTSEIVPCDHAVEVAIHTASGALDLDVVVYAVGHPSMLRRLTRAVCEGRAGATGATPEWGAKCPHPGYCPDDYDVVFPGLLAGGSGSVPTVFNSDTRAVEWARKWAQRIAERQYGQVLVVEYT